MKGKSGIFINRELSWLAFDSRVLELAKQQDVPLAERLNFAAIYQSNLDEFFMIRVGSLYDQTLLKKEKRENKTNMTPTEQLEAIMPVVRQAQAHGDKITAKLFARLKECGYEKVDFSHLEKDEERFWKQYFMRELYPVLSPQIIDRRHPFPFLRNLDVYAGARLKDKAEKGSGEAFGIIPLSSSQFEPVVFLPPVNNKVRFALTEDLVLHFAKEAFGRYTIEEKCLFRVTRNADINVQEGMMDHDIDLRQVMSELLKKRRKLAAVRLQFAPKVSPATIQYLCGRLMLNEKNCFVQTTPLDMRFARKLIGRLSKDGHSELFYPPARPMMPPAGFKVMEEVKHRDLLLAYPYQSIRPFVQLLRDAAADPDVISIKMTLYRMASESQIVEALISAAEAGKEVVTVVELRARFDEQNNIDWSKQLQDAGCTVIYGFENYKIHSKLTLITRKKGGQYSYISQIGTGNYNEKTAELYTDLCYISANQKLGEEVASVFNDLAVEHRTTETRRLLVAPYRFKSVLLDEIDREIAAAQQGEPARIVIKCNAMSDRDIILRLSQASQAGIHVQMIIRGICCMQTGVKGQTDNIEVRSIVGRYLEHSRIYLFGTGERERIYIASGDFLTRNTERRVEVGVRIIDAENRFLLRRLLELELQDNVNTRIMQPDGSYKRVQKKEFEAAVDSQMELYHLFADSWQPAAHSAEQPKPKAPSLLARLGGLFGRRAKEKNR